MGIAITFAAFCSKSPFLLLRYVINGYVLYKSGLMTGCFHILCTLQKANKSDPHRKGFACSLFNVKLSGRYVNCILQE